MHYEFVIQCNGYNRFHLAFLGDLTNTYICNLHLLTPLVLLQ